MNKNKYIFKENIKVLFIFFIFISLFIFFIFPHEVFAMEPTIVTDYYGQEVCIGTYTDFHPEPAPDIDSIQSSVSKPYGPMIDDDWYANKKESDYMHSVYKKNKVDSDKYSGFYHYLRRISFYYLWKIHSSEYNGYKDFKKSWDSSSSIRKEILKDIKSEL